MSAEQHEGQPESHSMRIAAAWTLVGIPLAYGLVETLRRASALFSG
ncbi:hypothetical protein I601_0191 [Nocardioides dokdonensis FR1436]|uniref:Uncharacterized protein n=1 Tax=Nocardioides dokdonensis FR1436 TaxID=1300347 RepID=A0A1A9GGN6_9ACTN|nr:hypothetical protein [Nocardioides dokdonensis]ANH36645.1 hypothetical protein I601_0191 [Nocardioides dokdonensis FR1436]